ncbi:MAG: hypothetical protein KGQ88_10330 [Chloroflexi bacterium]|nr:hypothetical protein [Chloroflexota bacterium]
MEAPRRYLVRERPLSSDDYDVPVGWWGWSWEPPVPMSLTEILAAGNLDLRTAALCWLVLEAHGSMLIAAEQPHSGKTTTLTAFLDVLPSTVRRVFIRGWAETFDYLRHTEPARTLLLANELSSHLPVYLWGPKAVETFRTLRKGYALASTLHADSADEAVAQLTGDLGIDPADLSRIDLLLVMRLYRAGTAYGPLVRRVVSVHRLVADLAGAVRPLPLVEWDAERDAHDHDPGAELEMLCLRRGSSPETLSAEIARREAYLGDLTARGVTDIPAVRDAFAEFRGEKLPRIVRGDPTA